MAQPLKQSAGPHVGPANAQQHDAIDLLAETLGGMVDAGQQACSPTGAILVQQPAGQFDETRVERIQLGRQWRSRFHPRYVLQHLPPGRLQGRLKRF